MRDYFRVHFCLAIGWSLCVLLLVIPNRFVDADRAVTVEGSSIENGSLPPPIMAFNATSVNTTRKTKNYNF